MKTANVSVVFVYGTLRGGQANSHLLENVAFYGWGKTREPAFRMYSAGGFSIVCREGDEQIVGEVYAVDDETLSRLDRLEGHPGWYRRQIVTIELERGTMVRAWIYLQKPSQLSQGVTHIPGADWTQRAKPKSTFRTMSKETDQ